MHSAKTRLKKFWATAIRPGKTMRIGIIGAGQLGQMLGFAARNLNAECRYLDPSENPPAAVCGKVIQSSFDDAVALVALADTCDVITYEFENVPVSALQHIDGIVPVYPPAAALRHSQDRLAEKLCLILSRFHCPVITLSTHARTSMMPRKISACRW